MELEELMRGLGRPSAHPGRVEAVEIRQTHASVVFLAGDHVYKIKKPVDFGFLNYSTLERRGDLCRREVEANARLAPGVYLGVVPATLEGDSLRFEGSGEVVEYAVKMRRLPDSAHLRARIEAGEEISPLLDQLAARLVDYYATAGADPVSKPTDPAGALDLATDRFERIGRQALENFEQASNQVGSTVDRDVFERLRALTAARLSELRPILALRSGSFTRLTHGDLRLDHVYHLPDRPEPERLVVIDCIEFNDDFRVADVASEVAFLAMDLIAAGREDLADRVVDSYQRLADDATCRRVIPFFVAYRSAVRAKVRGMAAEEAEIDPRARASALDRSRLHWLLALDRLESPARRPALVMIGGLPGTGKSTLARRIAALGGFEVIRSDEVRKRLAGAPADARPSPFGTGIYTSEWSDRTYAECRRLARESLEKGKRVIIDANFGREADRVAMHSEASRLGVRRAFFVVEADPALVRSRLEARSGDVSDADWAIHVEASRRWEPIQPDPATFPIDLDADSDRVLVEALASRGII
ncbi:MAG: AAA family ATPase [Isosphaeraceae bacterium]|nr:AAA family ATPase [Isosphaeraceae bacterium]